MLSIIYAIYLFSLLFYYLIFIAGKQETFEREKRAKAPIINLKFKVTLYTIVFIDLQLKCERLSRKSQKYAFPGQAGEA